MAKEPDPILKTLHLRRKDGGRLRMSQKRIRLIAKQADVDTEVVIRYFSGLEVAGKQASKIRFHSKKLRRKNSGYNAKGPKKEPSR